LYNGPWLQNLVSWTMFNLIGGNMKNSVAWWNYSIEELEQMADENGKITKEAIEKYEEEMTKDHELEHKY